MALQTANNAICTLQNPIQEDSTVIFLAGNYNRLPTSNFIVEIATFGADNETVIARENILVASRTGNQLVVGQRACEPVPIDDNASENIQQPLAFDIGGTVIKQVVSKALFDEINSGIADINEDISNIENNYVSKNQLNQEKGTTIATLGNDGKIPSNQIDTANLDVNSINYEFTAGTAITAGDCVGVYTGNMINNASKQINLYSSGGNAVTTNINFNNDDVFLASIDINLTGNRIGSYSMLSIEYDGFVLFKDAYATINGTLTVNVSINKFIKKGTRTAKVYGLGGDNYTYNVILNTQKPNNRTDKVCRMTNTTLQGKKFIGIALNSGSTGSKIRVKTSGVIDINGVDNGVSYTTYKGNLFPGLGVGVGIAQNKLYINPTNRICFIKLYLNNHNRGDGLSVDIYHTIGSIPLIILGTYNNTTTEVTPNSVNDTYFNFTIPQNGYYSFFLIG